MSEDELCVCLLGAFSVELRGEAVADGAWRLRKAKSLIKLLALAPDQRLHADQLTDLLWRDRDPASARNNLHQAIYAARRAIGSIGIDGRRYLELQDDVLALAPHAPVQIDVAEFERAATRAREQRDPAAYRAALACCRGELLPEDRYEEWTAARRETSNQLRLALAIELAELEAPSEPAAAIGRVREVLVDEPLHEPAHRALMRLYASSGRRQEALAQFQELKRGLRREFEDEPDDETRRLYQQLLARDSERPQVASAPAPAPGSASTSDNLPRSLTSFVGRERELAEATTLLSGARLLTLTGAGGCGKTRLAFQLALERLEDFPDGAWPVELAALGEPELLGPAVAQALDTRLASDRAAEVALAAHIGERRQLLLLDNCEHLVEPVAHLVEGLLRNCPNLTVLATSREPLRVPGEVTWRVPSLSLPRLEGEALADGSPEAESVRLFADRAGQATPGFALDEGNAAAIATLCHRLDGMPLAIELAAARVAVLTPTQIVERLDDSLDLLSVGARTAMTRQQTLRATLAWSFDLLDADEQVLLRRLAVFAGSFGLDAADAVCGSQPLEPGAVVALLGRLVDKSLVQIEEGAGEHRYRLLETVRQYAAEQLDAAGERDEFEVRHRDWYLELAESDPTPAGDLPARARLRRLDLERENLRAALASALIGDHQAGLRLAAALWRFWLMRGYLAEGNRWLDTTLRAAPERTRVRANTLLAASLVGLRRGDHERIHEFCAESVAIFAELDDHAAMFDAVEVSTAYRTIVSSEQGVEEMVEAHEGLAVDDLPAARPAAWAAHTRGIAAWFRREYPSARRYLSEALELVGGLAADPRPALWPTSYGVVWVEPEVGYPLPLQEETVVVGRRVGGEAAAAYILVNLAALDRAEGDFDRAAELTGESLARFKRIDDRQGEAYALNALGNLARSSGDYERGRSLLERSLALRKEIGDRRGAGITLGCLAVLQARSGDAAAGRASAERARAWLAENDDMIGLSAAELSLANVALSAGDRAEARAHLEAAAAIFAEVESMHQAGWTLAVLARMSAEDGEPEAGRGWLERARRHFELLGGEAGAEYCRQALQSER
jgi:predicted ATPase/DNA-binding SARP family transcriptional activator